MSTFGDMIDRIGAELERSDMDTVIGQHINDAIRTYKAKHWWFLQEPTGADKTNTTTASNSYVSLVSGIIQIDTMKITINGFWQDMRPISHTEMEMLHEGTDATGQPYAWTQYGERLRLYPTPDDAYTLTWTGLFEDATTLDDDADSNDWTNAGELLIRRTAKMTLLRDYLTDPAWQACLPGIAEAMQSLDREHIRRASTRTLKGSM